MFFFVVVLFVLAFMAGACINKPLYAFSVVFTFSFVDKKKQAQLTDTDERTLGAGLHTHLPIKFFQRMKIPCLLPFPFKATKAPKA